ncbi:MAG: PAS domain-containing sensor histidine kinase [Chitinophagaceae bacterium]|nr:PAS domain-containing sensor histidine kinase [Chitinophagaceae bacterium]
MSQQRIIIIKSICGVIVVLGFIVLAGWLLKIPLLTSIIPAYATMKVNTAILFILSSLELYRTLLRKWVILRGVLCFIITVVGFATLLEYELQLNFAIDEFFVKDFLFNATVDSFPGRMAKGTAFSFFLLGISLYLIKSDQVGLKKTAQYLLHTISLIAFLAIIGYVIGVPMFYKLSSIGSMAIHTAIGFLCLSIAATLINHELGITGLFTGNKIGNRMARQLFPALTLSVLFLGFMRIYLHRNNLVSVEFGIGIFATSFILIGLLLISISAQQLNKINYGKTQAEEKLEELNKNLERTILQRTHELRNNEQLLNAIINNTSSAIFVKDVFGNYILVNKKFAADFDIEPELLIGKNAYDIFSKEIADKLTRDEQEIIQSKKGLTSEINIQTSESQKTMLTNKFPLIDENNTVFAICCVATDFSEMKNAKTEQEILSLQLQKKNQQLLNFAHITSHNLRSPVSNLNSLLWLYKESQTNEEKALLFEKFETVIHNLSETLNELVDALKIQEDTDKKREVLLFEEVFKKVKESMVGKIMETEAVVSYNFTKAPTIEYPRLYLESILQNLLSNSLKYKSPNRTPVIHAETQFQNGILTLKFSDNGMGIDLKRHADKLFGLNKTFHKHAEAKGVGLFITKTQVEAMGGSITVDSEVNRGSVFTILFNKKEL